MLGVQAVMFVALAIAWLYALGTRRAQTVTVDDKGTLIRMGRRRGHADRCDGCDLYVVGGVGDGAARRNWPGNRSRVRTGNGKSHMILRVADLSVRCGQCRLS